MLAVAGIVFKPSDVAGLVERLRTDRACRELLDSDQGVAEIAFDVG